MVRVILSTRIIHHLRVSLLQGHSTVQFGHSSFLTGFNPTIYIKKFERVHAFLCAPKMSGNPLTDPRGVRDARARGPNSLISIQFSAKIID